jgi:peptidyl-dipeptidase Dcp
VALNNQGDFDGLPEGLRKAAMAQAKERNLMLGVIGNTRSFVEPFLTFSNDRELIQSLEHVCKRGDNENEFDNKATLVQILQLRAKKAKLLGFLLSHTGT